MLVICALIGFAIFLYGLPACLGKGAPFFSSLFSRIEIEQQAELDQAFERRQARWTLVRLLERHPPLLQRLCRWTGIHASKTEEIISRLHLPIRLVEVVLARLICMCLVASSLLALLLKLAQGEMLGIKTGYPLMLSLGLYLLPTFYLDWMDKRAKAEIREQVPVFFGIVQSLVEAGMPLQGAVKQTARRFNARLGQELAKLEVAEKRHGSWRKALEELAFRWEVDTLTTIALEMNEAVTKGVSISQMLSVQIEEQVRQQEDEAAAHMNRLNIRLLPFVILFMGVPLLFLVMGPALMGIGERL
ncbi:type II secretion system F family protein [Brevibacillus agri]|uniref:type II secretion system F family protein n=1 Tax=Brevibacillus agri TaxID=51101 RepID=UPI00286FEC3F|nr:type II secretion system F family protein [Brevibacillus agri]MDR9507222.1 type II secretion system F family protein [Brevibacillus agri]